MSQNLYKGKTAYGEKYSTKKLSNSQDSRNPPAMQFGNDVFDKNSSPTKNTRSSSKMKNRDQPELQVEIQNVRRDSDTK